MVLKKGNCNKPKRKTEQKTNILMQIEREEAEKGKGEQRDGI